ncbi:hypothetical protein NC652_025614 [Populus alba x Populus x berolinensis]|nr:hypothetical protein NC652_025614 [Populus alba x Populus x berolinensis]
MMTKDPAQLSLSGWGCGRINWMPPSRPPCVLMSIIHAATKCPRNDLTS